MIGDQVQSVPDSELFGTSVKTEYNSDQDSDYTDSNISIQSTCDDIEDGLSFVCDQCNKIFKTLGSYTKHMQASKLQGSLCTCSEYEAV